MAQSSNYLADTAHKNVSVLLGIGILFLPIIFVWLLLKPCYSTLARSIGFGWLAFFFLVGVVSSSHTVSQQPPTVPTHLASPATTSAHMGSDAFAYPDWHYWDNTDKMSGEVSHYASLVSSNVLHFDSPYGDQTADLTLVKDASGNVSAWISVKAQFLGYFPDGVARVKFDHDKVEWWSCHELAGGEHNTLYIKNERRFIKRLTRAKKLVIEAQFYRDGFQRIEFDVAGLEWK